MILKDGVSLEGCRPEILIAAITIMGPIFKKYGHEGVVTSAAEKQKHSAKRSTHYKGDALDWRCWFFDDETKQLVLQELTTQLGKHFVVVLESDHYHTHYAPVYEA